MASRPSQLIRRLNHLGPKAHLKPRSGDLVRPMQRAGRPLSQLGRRPRASNRSSVARGVFDLVVSFMFLFLSCCRLGGTPGRRACRALREPQKGGLQTIQVKCGKRSKRCAKNDPSDVRRTIQVMCGDGLDRYPDIAWIIVST